MKIFKIILVSFFLVLCTIAGLGLYFGHPNDARIQQPDLSNLTPQHQYEKRTFALFMSTKTHKVSVSREKYQEELEKVRQFPEVGSVFQTDSARFKSPWQIYLAVGSHPEKLEGRNSILIPPGKSLSFRPELRGRGRLEMGGISAGGSSVIDLYSGGRRVKSWSLEKKTPARNNSDPYYKNLGRYLKPDAPVPGGKWQYLSAGFQLNTQDTIQLSCRGEGYCIISEPQIWQHTIETRPNLLFILVDTMRKDAIEDPDAAPFMYHFRENNISFTENLAAGNMTSPSTNALLSCQKPSSLGNLAFSYALNHEQKNQYYNRKKPSFPFSFREHGWQTAMIGNISVISEVMDVAVDHGFEQQISVERPGYDTAQISREAVNWLQQNGQKPFFLYLHFHAPHAPYRAPFKDIFSTFPGFSSLKSYANIIRWLYKGEIHYSDRYIKQVADSLKALKLDEMTTVVITADHGDHHETRVFQDNEAGPAFEGTYFDHGATLYQDEIRVPLVIKQAHSHRKKIISESVSGLDLGPTLLDMFQINKPGWCEGNSLMPLIGDHAEKAEIDALHDRVIGFEGFNRRGILFDQRYKYIRQYSTVDKKVHPPDGFGRQMVSYFSEDLLFDLAEDPSEQNNLTYTKKELLRKAKKVYERYYNPESTYELVINNPRNKEVEILTSRKDQYFDFAPDAGSTVRSGRKNLFKLQVKNRYRWSTDSRPESLPEIRIDGKKVPVKISSLQLPLSFLSLSHLSPESKETQEGLALKDKPSAYIRKVEAHGVHNRQIRSGNPTFEKLLKEWGYLNDNS